MVLYRVEVVDAFVFRRVGRVFQGGAALERLCIIPLGQFFRQELVQEPRPLIVPSGAEARRRMLESDFELIVVNAPLPDEFGHDLCATAVEKTDAGVVFLVKAAAAEQLLTPMSEQGVLLVCKPFSNTLFLQAIHMAAASNHRLQVLRQENARMQEKLQQVRLVSRAKCCLIAERGMSEAEAHRYIEKNAMDTRRDRAEIAQEILDSYDPSGV